MAKEDVLARVKEDLARGHTHLATQRLRTLVAIDPDDFELRRMLAEVYRQTGNLVEAGRWGFLTGEVTDAELAAFERANPDPWLRHRLVRWGGDEAELPCERARARWRELAAAAERAGPPDGYRGPLRPPQRAGRLDGSTIPCLFVTVALGVLGTLAAIGMIRIVLWLIG